MKWFCGFKYQYWLAGQTTHVSSASGAKFSITRSEVSQNLFISRFFRRVLISNGSIFLVIRHYCSRLAGLAGVRPLGSRSNSACLKTLLYRCWGTYLDDLPTLVKICLAQPNKFLFNAFRIAVTQWSKTHLPGSHTLRILVRCACLTGPPNTPFIGLAQSTLPQCSVRVSSRHWPSAFQKSARILVVHYFPKLN